VVTPSPRLYQIISGRRANIVWSPPDETRFASAGSTTERTLESGVDPRDAEALTVGS
jgi:hypothetical protein